MDFDADGDTDVLSGSWPGELYFFERKEDGSFEAPTQIKDKNDQVIDAGNASTVFAVDWDADKDLDLVLGDIRGNVHVVINEGFSRVAGIRAAHQARIEQHHARSRR